MYQIRKFFGKSIRKLRIFLYFPWFFDLFIAIGALILFVSVLFVLLTNKNLASFLDVALSLTAFSYSFTSFLTKWNNDKKEMDVFKISSETIFSTCEHVIMHHFPDANQILDKSKEKILRTYFDDWKKHGSIKPFEYEFIDNYLDHFVADYSLGESDKVFLKYRIITSDYSIYFSRLVSEIEKGDFYSNDSLHNKFIKKIYLFSYNPSFTSEDVANLELDGQQITDTMSLALKTNNEFIEELLQDKKRKTEIQYLLNKCYENAYTNIGSLDVDLKDDSTKNLIFMFKYDERFSILKRIWHTAIKNYLSNKFVKESERDAEYKKAEDKLKAVMLPQPFSKAIKEFDYCINQIGNDKFSFIIDQGNFDNKALSWTPEKFINDMVIPRAQQHLEDFNKKLIKEFPYLKKHQKKTLDANYYLFFFNRKDFQYFADQNAIPTAIKRFLIKEILDSENAAEHVASQLVYVKQIISKISISGLLFTEDFKIQEAVHKKESQIISKAQKSGILINSIYEISSMGNKVDEFLKIFYEVFFGKKLKRKLGKEYEFAKTTVGKIIQNAKDLTRVFETLKSSDNPR